MFPGAATILPAVAAAVLAAVLLLAWLRPLWLLRLFVRTVYRLRVTGRDNVPRQGGALLVCNQVTYLDGLLVLAALRRPVRFVVFAGWTRRPLARYLLRRSGAIILDGGATPRDVIRAFRAAAEALSRGELVCIFAEGRRTSSGLVLPFQRGFKQIVRRCPAPIIPVNLAQPWGSLFS